MSESSKSGLEFIEEINKQHLQMEQAAARQHNGVFHDPIYARPSHEDFVKFRRNHPQQDPKMASSDVFKGITDLKVTQPAGYPYYLDLVLYGKSEKNA